MEYLDPQRRKRYRISLLTGYALVTIGIAVGILILVWQAFGYNVQDGQVVQDGMIFVSSQPNPASIYVNGVLNAATTNTRLTLPEGVYSFKLTSPGYRPWKHVISVLGDQVVHYDYPLLIPSKLVSKTITSFTAAPAFATQSPSLQYLVMPSPTGFTTFYRFNLNNPTAAPATITLPAGLISTASTTQSWQVVGWANDNRHLLLEHLYDGTQEFIEVDTANPAQSININRTFNVTPTKVTFNNLKSNQFYFYDSSTDILDSATIGSTPTQVATSVVAYKSYQNSNLLYATTSGAPSGEVAVELITGGNSYFVRNLPLASTYLLDMAGYNSNDYAVIGDSSANFVYIYQNPSSQATSGPGAKILPFRALKINSPNFEQFAPTAQFILVENGTELSVYDILNDNIYHYVLAKPLDAPQQHVYWMDGDRFNYVSGASVNIIDYDNTNEQVLTPALPQYPAFFASNYLSYFTLSQKANHVELDQISLVAS